MGEKKERFSVAALARSLQLPEDCQKGRTLVNMQGRERVCIENFKGIFSYSPEEIRLTTRREQICVCGVRLQIDCYTRDEIEISGLIKKIEYL